MKKKYSNHFTVAPSNSEVYIVIVGQYFKLLKSNGLSGQSNAECSHNNPRVNPAHLLLWLMSNQMIDPGVTGPGALNRSGAVNDD